MNARVLAGLPLRLQLACRRAGMPGCMSLLLCLSGAAGWAWLLPQRAALASAAQRDAVVPQVVAAAVVTPPGQQNLSAFYAMLGAPQDAGELVRTLFALAARTGLQLKQGEYKAGHDQASQLATYQVTLPVKGSYAAIWQFVQLTLRAAPFAALDDISFKRDAIADAEPEALLHLSFFLLPTIAGGSQ